eukprot:Amastigsp_a508708_95.p4 type:complete len:108 gc:universal Amastigsp_a508708_95:376-53(-)
MSPPKTAITMAPTSMIFTCASVIGSASPDTTRMPVMKNPLSCQPLRSSAIPKPPPPPRLHAPQRKFGSGANRYVITTKMGYQFFHSTQLRMFSRSPIAIKNARMTSL